jgi:hypothetical protein
MIRNFKIHKNRETIAAKEKASDFVTFHKFQTAQFSPMILSAQILFSHSKAVWNPIIFWNF